MVSARLARRRAAASLADMMRRAAITLLCGIAIGAIAYGAIMLAADPRFALGSVDVVGTHRLQPSEVVAAAAFPAGRNIWLLDTAGAARAIARLPWIASASVERAWPDKVTVAVVERVPVVRLTLPMGPPMLVDAQAKALGPARDPADEALPALSVEPLPAGADEAGTALAGTAVGEALDALSRLYALGVRMTEIRSDPVMGFRVRTASGFDVVLGDLDDLARKVALFNAISARLVRPDGVDYVDVRSTSAPTVRYR